MKRRFEKALLFVMALAMLLSMLPVSAMGETQTGAAGGFVSKGKDIPDMLMILNVLNDNLEITLPVGSKPADKIIPRRCITVHQNYLFTVPVVVAPATQSALRDLRVLWNNASLPIVGAKYKGNSNRATVYLTFLAAGKPTNTWKIGYQSLTRKAVKSQTYVTIVPTKVKSVLLPATDHMYANQPGSLQLTATVLPDEASNKAVKWSSSNTSVATVNASGQVVAHDPGTATIYVVTVSGHKKAKCTITVTQPMY